MLYINVPLSVKEKKRKSYENPKISSLLTASKRHKLEDVQLINQIDQVDNQNYSLQETEREKEPNNNILINLVTMG